MNKPRFLAFLFFFLLTAAGTSGLIYPGLAVSVAGLLLTGAGVSGLIIIFFSGRFIPLPFSVKKWVLFRLALPFVSLGGKDEAVSFFTELINRMNPREAGKVLILLPSCLQSSSCNKDLGRDTGNCAGCGRCQVSFILDKVPEEYEVALVKGGRAATEKIKDYAPRTVIAVACEKELAEGILSSLKTTVWAVRLIRPEGPCRNTRMDENEFIMVLEGLK